MIFRTSSSVEAMFRQVKQITPPTTVAATLITMSMAMLISLPPVLLLPESSIDGGEMNSGETDFEFPGSTLRILDGNMTVTNKFFRFAG